MKSLYEITGNIEDINTMLVPRSEAERKPLTEEQADKIIAALEPLLDLKNQSWKLACDRLKEIAGTNPAPTQQPVLVRDLAEILGVTVPEVCHELEECGGPRRSTNMAVSGEEALAVATKLKRAAKPVAFDVRCDDCDGTGLDRTDNNYSCAVCDGSGFVEKMLCTSPPPTKSWVGLTPQDFTGMDVSNAFEAGAWWADVTLQEKNA